MEHGSTGVFKGIFTVLSVFIGLFGVVVTYLSLFGGFTPDWNAGTAVITDGLILGALFIVMGVGFMTFGVMIGREGWDAPGA